MSLRRHIFAAAATAALVATFATAAAAGPWSLAPGEYYTQLEGSFRSAGTYYDDEGNRVALGGLSEARAISSYTEFGWTKHVSAQLALPFQSLTSRVNQPLATATNTGLGDFSLGLRYAIHNGPSALALQLQWDAPTGYDRTLVPAMGSGDQALSARLQLGRPLGHRGFVQLGAGYRYDYRSAGGRSTSALDSQAARDWSDHSLVDAAAGFWFGNLMLAGLYDGQFAAQTGRSLKTTTQLAGPRLTYRVDDRLDAYAGSWHSPAGKNVLHVDQYYAGVAWKVTKLNRLQGFLGGNRTP